MCAGYLAHKQRVAGPVDAVGHAGHTAGSKILNVRTALKEPRTTLDPYPTFRIAGTYVGLNDIRAGLTIALLVILSGKVADALVNVSLLEVRKDKSAPTPTVVVSRVSASVLLQLHTLWKDAVTAGSNSAIKIPMTAITTKSSMSVNPCRLNLFAYISYQRSAISGQLETPQKTLFPETES